MRSASLRLLLSVYLVALAFVPYGRSQIQDRVCALLFCERRVPYRSFDQDIGYCYACKKEITAGRAATILSTDTLRRRSSIPPVPILEITGSRWSVEAEGRSVAFKYDPARTFSFPSTTAQTSCQSFRGSDGITQYVPLSAHFVYQQKFFPQQHQGTASPKTRIALDRKFGTLPGNRTLVLEFTPTEYLPPDSLLKKPNYRLPPVIQYAFFEWTMHVPVERFMRTKDSFKASFLDGTETEPTFTFATVSSIYRDERISDWQWVPHVSSLAALHVTCPYGGFKLAPGELATPYHLKEIIAEIHKSLKLHYAGNPDQVEYAWSHMVNGILDFMSSSLKKLTFSHPTEDLKQQVTTGKLKGVTPLCQKAATVWLKTLYHRPSKKEDTKQGDTKKEEMQRLLGLPTFGRLPPGV